MKKLYGKRFYYNDHRTNISVHFDHDKNNTVLKMEDDDGYAIAYLNIDETEELERAFRHAYFLAKVAKGKNAKESS